MAGGEFIVYMGRVTVKVRVTVWFTHTFFWIFFFLLHDHGHGYCYQYQDNEYHDDNDHFSGRETGRLLVIVGSGIATAIISRTL